MSNEQKITVTDKELKAIVADAIEETLTKLGMDTSEVHDTQRDLLFLRELRETHEKIKSKAIVTLIGFIVLATMTLLILGFKSWIPGV